MQAPGMADSGRFIQLDDPGAQYAQLIQSVASRRDREAFALLFKSLAPKVKGYMIKRGAHQALAEDLAVETFVKIWRKADGFDPLQGGAPAWIFTIARNTYVDVVRRERHASDLDRLGSDEAGPATPENECLHAELEQRVQSALRKLPRDQAQVIEMSFFQDRPHSEIATAFNLPLGTVKSRLRLGLPVITVPKVTLRKLRNFNMLRDVKGITH